MFLFLGNPKGVCRSLEERHIEMFDIYFSIMRPVNSLFHLRKRLYSEVDQVPPPPTSRHYSVSVLCWVRARCSRITAVWIFLCLSFKITLSTRQVSLFSKEGTLLLFFILNCNQNYYKDTIPGFQNHLQLLILSYTFSFAVFFCFFFIW